MHNLIPNITKFIVLPQIALAGFVSCVGNRKLEGETKVGSTGSWVLLTPLLNSCRRH